VTARADGRQTQTAEPAAATIESRGEEYRENWQDCPECHGEGTIDEEEE